MQFAWYSQPHEYMLLTMRSFLCISVQANILLLFSICAFQICLACTTNRINPLNWIWYVEREEYLPSSVHIQIMESWTSGCNCILWSLIHSDANSSTWTVVVMLFQSGWIHALFPSSCSIDLVFLFITSKGCRPKFLGASTSSYLRCQNRAFFPFPTEAR